MTTAQDLINETRRYLLPTAREGLNTLSGNVGANDTSITVTYDPTSITAGSYLSIDTEVLYVWSISGQTAQVQRGMQGSTAASHASGTLVTTNPRFSDWSVFQALNAELDDLSTPANGLYQVGTVDLTWKPQIQGYDLTSVTNLIDVLRVRFDLPGPWKTWPEIRRWQLKTNMPTGSSDFPSGYALVLYEPGWPGRRVHVLYSSRFAHFAASTDNLTVTGLPATAADIPPLGAAARLTGVRETQRNLTEAQSDPRRATEVPPQAQRAGMQNLELLRTQRIRAEVARLQGLYPPRRRV